MDGGEWSQGIVKILVAMDALTKFFHFGEGRSFILRQKLSCGLQNVSNLPILKAPFCNWLLLNVTLFMKLAKYAAIFCLNLNTINLTTDHSMCKISKAE